MQHTDTQLAQSHQGTAINLRTTNDLDCFVFSKLGHQPCCIFTSLITFQLSSLNLSKHAFLVKWSSSYKVDTIVTIVTIEDVMTLSLLSHYLPVAWGDIDKKNLITIFLLFWVSTSPPPFSRHQHRPDVTARSCPRSGGAEAEQDGCVLASGDLRKKGAGKESHLDGHGIRFQQILFFKYMNATLAFTLKVWRIF